MHNLYIMWLYALPFVTCKVDVNAFSLLYSKLLLAKLSLFEFGATFAELRGIFFKAYVAVLCVTNICRLLSLRG